ncbi:sigma factor-like helix-turn-helix DNA-binding protein [Nocardioides sp. Root151]|uniref:sigma factor-like helix-turn-helix DNA-binding protein n=1 Tax=Nocardioides sp. Root151 TaxID=1736475 RepID=UPI00138F77AC|nr:sigma factor-like helix-turn-helix DNA-binding protein [Nocardioides sp. Root151]
MHMYDEESRTLGDRFVALHGIAEKRLDSPDLDYLFVGHFEQLRRMFVRYRITSVGDLLTLSRSDLMRLPMVGTKKADYMVALLERLSGHTAAGQSDSRSEIYAPTFGDRFPSLRPKADLALNSTLLNSVFMGQTALRDLLGRVGYSTVGDLLASTEAEVHSLRGIGATKLVSIVALLQRLSDDVDESKADAPVRMVPASALGKGWDLDDLGPDEVQVDWDLDDEAVSTMIEWAREMSDDRTWGGLLECLMSRPLPDDVKPTFAELAERPLPAVLQPDARTFLDAWTVSRGPRDLEILDRRVLADKPATLDELGGHLGVTRERVRQLESKLLSAIQTEFRDSSEWRSVRWAVERVRDRCGAYCPGDQLQVATRGQQLVRWLAELEAKDDVLIRRGFKLPEIPQVPRAEEEAMVDEPALAEMLRGSGVAEKWTAFATDRIVGLRRIDERLVLWPTSQVERAISVLTVRGMPMDPDELGPVVGELSPRSFRQRLFSDQRLRRVSKDFVALANWGGEEYTSIADLMVARLEQGPMLLEDLVQTLFDSHGVSAASVRLYSRAPAFLMRGQQVELRTSSHPYEPRNQPERVTGLYRISEDQILLSLVVDRDVVRGSGRSVAHEVATFMGVLPGSSLTLHSDIKDVQLSWRERSNIGPQMGSLKALVEDAGVSQGERVHLVLDREYFTIEARRPSEPTARESREQMLHRLTGLELNACVGLAGVAWASWSSEFEVVAALDERGDSEVAAVAALRISG